ncbi:6-bladed beta-propeller [Roseivirga echinicomitans]|uniref:6-bladed beta-propeller n=1 Tax=Roseivirga echinicomitans TaxID=296218 RepID=UPI001C86BC81|nr:6-bladed beta-propeller [Roseivirga echinicomitans]
MLDTLVIGPQEVIKSWDLDFEKNDVQFYPLANDKDLLIGNVQYMDFLGSNVVLFDNKIHQILIFNSSYELIKRIESKGEGPGEFKFLECFFVDKERGEIVIFDSRLFKFLTYTAQGEFVKEKKVEYFARDLFKVGDKWLINNAWSDDKSNPYQIFVADDNFEILNKLKPQDKSIVSTIANPAPFIKTDSNDVIFYEPLSDTVYQLSSSLDKLTPFLLFDFQGLEYTKDMLYSSRIREFIDKVGRGKYKGWVRGLLINNDDKLFQFFETNGSKRLENVMALYQEEQLKLFSQFTIGGGLKVFYPKLIKDGRYFSVLSSEMIENFREENLEWGNLSFEVSELLKNAKNSGYTYLVSFKL